MRTEPGAAAANMVAMTDATGTNRHGRSPVERVVRLADGRAVGVVEHGDPSGDIVFLLHGTPASRLGFEFTHDLARQRRLRIVCPDRPGIGRSETNPQLRCVADYASELEALADALGVGRFSVIGYSGGAAFALAAAARLRSRTKSTALLAGAGPLDRPGARASLGGADRLLLELCERRPLVAGAVLRAAAGTARLAPQAALLALRADLGDADRRVVHRGDRGMPLVRSFVEALRQGPGGVIDDYRIQARPWGFALEEVRGHVDLWHGDADGVVPLARAEDLVAALPDAGLTRIAGEGHISIQDHLGAVLDGIRGSADR